MNNIILSEINIYPIKSLGGVALDAAKVCEGGLEFDRRWMLVDEQGVFLTQRELPPMATLKVELDSECLRISTHNGANLNVPFEINSVEKKRVKVWSSSVRAQIYDDATNAWFSEVLQKKCRLVKMPADEKRLVSPFYAVRKYEDTVSFADGFPVLLIGENSLADLNSKLENPLPMNRFRPNLVVKNAEAFAEDKWKKIKIGETVFHLVKPCARCVITTINQETGISDGKEPLKTLAAYRLVKRAGASKINFGQNLIAENSGAKIKFGDRVEIIETKR